MNQKENVPQISREILSYLGPIPQELQKDGNEAAARLAIQIGNLLLWIHPQLAPGEPHIEQPLHESPQTIWALGKQFRQVGVELWGKPSPIKKIEERLTLVEDCLSGHLQESKPDQELAKTCNEYLKQKLAEAKAEKGGKK